MSVFGRLLVALVLMSCSKAAAETELDQFFPSNPIHKDDRLSGDFEAIIEDRSVKLTEVSGSFATIRLFDVQSYETDPGRLAWPYGKQLSTRYNVTWFAREQVLDQAIEELNAKLRELRISWRDRRTLSPNELQGKSNILENWLSEISSGGHGSFARQNHTARYLTDDHHLLISARINTVMEFPVRAGDMPLLAHAMYRHALTCS
ncbi:hypothetical protein [Phaeobacter sp. NW0010-22]|uniref:hypothetical protein n=1 Tax=Phaeobacter sp. NW0010-22 TaxID=3135907 RepID=UPI00333FFFDC